MATTKGTRQPGTTPEDIAFERAMLDRLPPPTIVRVAFRLAGIVGVALLTWRAVQYRGATASALLLPFAAEFVTAIVVSLALLPFIRDPVFRRETLQGWRVWLPILVVVVAWQGLAAAQADRSIVQQLGGHLDAFIGYARSHGMVWPMLAASALFVAGVVPDVQAYAKHGPPFVYLGVLGLAMRCLVIFILCFWLAFAFDSNRRQRAEVMWFLLLVAELAALALPWLVQRQIAKAYSAKDAAVATAKAKRARR